MLSTLAFVGFLSFLSVGFSAPAQNKDSSISYQLVPIKLRKFVSPEVFNSYNALPEEKKAQIAELGEEFKETSDKNQYLHNVIKISNRFASTILRAYYSKIYIVADTSNADEKARFENQAEKAYQLVIALTSRDQAFIDKALQEARDAA